MQGGCGTLGGGILSPSVRGAGAQPHAPALSPPGQREDGGRAPCRLKSGLAESSCLLGHRQGWGAGGGAVVSVI